MRSARIKLARANLHAGTARREARRFFNRHPEPTFRIDPHGEPRVVAIGEVFGCKLVIDRGWPDLPDSFAARFGDALHNYRCVLDHLAWQLVSHGLCPPRQMNERQRREIQFPAYSAEQGFTDSVSRRLPGVDPTILDLIKARHQYVGGQATNDALMSLIDLSNDDKHRTLTIITSAILNVRHQVTFTDCNLVSFRNPPIRPAAKDDAVVALLECRRTGLNPNVSMKFQPAFHIAMENGRGFGDVLEDIRVEVTEILDSPQILAAIS